MTEGVIQGGWNYVWASYFITWGSIALYALSLFMRDRRSAKEAEELSKE